MKKMVRPLIAGMLLVPGLVLLPGCDWYKAGTCASCEVDKGIVQDVAAEDVLLSIDGKPAITKDQFEEFYQAASANAGPFGAPKKEAFDQMMSMAVLDQQLKKDGKDTTPDYKQAYTMARWSVNVQMLAKDLQDTIDVSDRALEQFYNEQRGKNQAFDRPPFLKSSESIALEAVEFDSKDAAEEFLKKAKSNFAGAAQSANKEIKNYANVSAQSQDVPFPIRLKVKGMDANTVELVPAGDKFYVIKSGAKSPAVYATFSELTKNPQIKEMLSQAKKQLELEEVFMKRLDDYKKGFTLTVNEDFFKAAESEREEQEEKIRELISEKMKDQNTKDAPPVKASSGVVAA